MHVEGQGRQREKEPDYKQVSLGRGGDTKACPTRSLDRQEKYVNR